MDARLLVPLAVAIVVAGCAGAAKSAPAASLASTTAPAPTVDAETGSITGLIVDDEALPIGGARVGILKTDYAGVTDAGGAFTINGVPPGTHSLVAEALGYTAQGRKVDVVAGEITHANFTLVAIGLDAFEPYHESWNRVGFINVDQTWVTYVYHDIGDQNHSQLCGSCVFTLQFPPNGVEFLSEFSWTQTGIPAYNDGVHVALLAGGVWGNDMFCWRAQGNWTNSGSPAGLRPQLAKGVPAQFTIESSFAGVSFQHRVDMWTTVGYLEELPDEFTAFPPTTEKAQDPSVCIIS